METVQANENGPRYRYDVTRPDATRQLLENEWQGPAGEIEKLVLYSLSRFLRAANAMPCRKATERQSISA